MLVYTSRIQSFMTDKAWWQEQKVNWFHCIHSEGAASGQEVGEAYKALSLPINDTHPTASGHLIKVPRALQTALNLVFLRVSHSKTWAYGCIFAFNPLHNIRLKLNLFHLEFTFYPQNILLSNCSKKSK